jgi:hypothetical protein
VSRIPNTFRGTGAAVVFVAIALALVIVPIVALVHG